MVSVDVAFVQQILHIPKRGRETDIHHHGQTDDLGARLEVARRAAFCHLKTLISHPARLNRFCSDSTPRSVNNGYLDGYKMRVTIGHWCDAKINLIWGTSKCDLSSKIAAGTSPGGPRERA